MSRLYNTGLDGDFGSRLQGGGMIHATYRLGSLTAYPLHNSCRLPLLNAIYVARSLDGPLQPGRPYLEPGVRQLLYVFTEHLGVRVPTLGEIRVASDVARKIVLGFA